MKTPMSAESTNSSACRRITFTGSMVPAIDVPPGRDGTASGCVWGLTEIVLMMGSCDHSLPELLLEGLVLGGVLDLRIDLRRPSQLRFRLGSSVQQRERFRELDVRLRNASD